MPLWEKVLVDLQPFHWLIVEAFLDPVVILIGLFVGWKGDQAGKLIIAGLAAGLAGTVVAFIVRQVGLNWFDGGYEFGGAHAFFRIFAGFVWSIAGYLAARIRDRRAGKSPPV